MRLFKIDHADGESTNFVVCTPVIDSEWFYLCWSLGRPFENEVLEPIIYNVDGKAHIDDFPCVNAGQFLVSSRIFKILDHVSASYDSYKSTLIKEDGTELKDYFTINFTEAFSCFHRDQTQHYVDEDGFTRVKGPITYDKQRIPKDREIFRVQEGIEVLVTENFRNRIKLSGTTGMDFVEVKVI